MRNRAYPVHPGKKNHRYLIGFGASLGLILILSLAASCLTAKQGSQKKSSLQTPYEPTSNYVVREIEGWQVYVHKELSGEKAKLGDEALRVLRFQLYLISKWAPAEPLRKLRQVPIWLNDRVHGKNHFHPNRKWLIENNYNPAKTRAVDIERVGRFINVAGTNVNVLMHELAHAYHNRVLGFNDPRIQQAYRKAVESGTYKSVLRMGGKNVRHYALTDHKEYFAESTEAFFGTNDFYPFVRAELQKHDPDMYQLLREIWLGD